MIINLEEVLKEKESKQKETLELILEDDPLQVEQNEYVMAPFDLQMKFQERRASVRQEKNEMEQELQSYEK